MLAMGEGKTAGFGVQQDVLTTMRDARERISVRWYQETNESVLEQVFRKNEICRMTRSPDACPHPENIYKFQTVNPRAGPCVKLAKEEGRLKRWSEFKGKKTVATLFPALLKFAEAGITHLFFLGDSVMEQVYSAALDSVRRSLVKNVSGLVVDSPDTLTGLQHDPLSFYHNQSISCTGSHPTMYIPQTAQRTQARPRQTFSFKLRTTGGDKVFSVTYLRVVMWNTLEITGRNSYETTRKYLDDVLNFINCSMPQSFAVVCNIGLHYGNLAHYGGQSVYGGIENIPGDIMQMFHALDGAGASKIIFLETEHQHFATSTGNYFNRTKFGSAVGGWGGVCRGVKDNEVGQDFPTCKIEWLGDEYATQVDEAGRKNHRKNLHWCKWKKKICDLRISMCAMPLHPDDDNERNQLAIAAIKRISGEIRATVAVAPFFQISQDRIDMRGTAFPRAKRNLDDGRSPFQSHDCTHLCTTHSPLFFEPVWHAIGRA
jgi:hypothetical protein